MHSCAIDEDAAVHCWGTNDSGQASPPAGEFHQLGAGYRFTCGIDTAGIVQCWGIDTGSSEDYGQVTDAPTDNGVVAVGVGWYHACALREDGDITCWGLNDYGQASP